MSMDSIQMIANMLSPVFYNFTNSVYLQVVWLTFKKICLLSFLDSW